jgi:hypothetical protein
MTSLIGAVDMALYNALAAAPVHTFVGGRVYAVNAPPESPLPYAVFAFVRGGERRSASRSARLLYKLAVYATDHGTVRTGAGLIDAALAAGINVMGWQTYHLAPVNLIYGLESAGDVPIYFAGALYAIQLCAS